jgi:hypothetical protein
VSSHDVDSLLCTRWCFVCCVCCGCSSEFGSTGSESRFPKPIGDLGLPGDSGGGMYVRSMGDSSPGVLEGWTGFASLAGGGCRWNCELDIPLCTSRIAVEMTDSRGPISDLRRGNSCAGGGSGSALKGGSSTDRSLTIRAIEAVWTVAGSSSSISSMDRCSSRDSPLIGRAGSDFPLPFEYPGSSRRSSSMRLVYVTRCVR